MHARTRALSLVHINKLASLRVRETVAHAACSLTRRPCSGQLQTAPALMPALSKGEGAMRDWIRARPTKRRCVHLRACGVFACRGGAVLGRGRSVRARVCMCTGDHGGWVPAVEVRTNAPEHVYVPALRSFTLTATSGTCAPQGGTRAAHTTALVHGRPDRSMCPVTVTTTPPPTPCHPKHAPGPTPCTRQQPRLRLHL